MKPLQPPHSIHVRAAEGWVELGNLPEAHGELEKIPARLRTHPEVLEVRWQIGARAGEWETCLQLARAMVKRAPELSSGWIGLSFALHELKMTKEAWDNLLGVAHRFPQEPTIPYNLACYGAQLGRLWEAERWLKQAFQVGEPKVLKPFALADPDLKPLWERIAEL